jgi:hypothetical protein
MDPRVSKEAWGEVIIQELDTYNFKILFAQILMHQDLTLCIKSEFPNPILEVVLVPDESPANKGKTGYCRLVYPTSGSYPIRLECGRHELLHIELNPAIFPNLICTEESNETLNEGTMDTAPVYVREKITLSHRMLDRYFLYKRKIWRFFFHYSLASVK